MSSCLLVQWPCLLFRDAVVSWINVNGGNTVTKSKSGLGIDLVFLSKLLLYHGRGRHLSGRDPVCRAVRRAGMIN